MSISDDPEVFLRDVLRQFRSFGEDLATYTERQNMFSSKMVEQLLSLQNALKTTTKNLQDEFDHMNGGADPIRFLVSLNHSSADRHGHVSLPSGLNEQQFRASILSSTAPTLQQQQRIIVSDTYPVYISALPALPTTLTTFSINVYISKSESYSRTVSLSAIAQECIARTVHELSLPIPAECALFKAIGLDEYIYGAYPLRSFQCIREAIRRGNTLSVIVVEDKGADAATLERLLGLGRHLLTDFKTKIDPETIANDPESIQVNPQMTPYQEYFTQVDNALFSPVDFDHTSMLDRPSTTTPSLFLSPPSMNSSTSASSSIQTNVIGGISNDSEPTTSSAYPGLSALRSSLITPSKHRGSLANIAAYGNGSNAGEDALRTSALLPFTINMEQLDIEIAQEPVIHPLLENAMVDYVIPEHQKFTKRTTSILNIPEMFRRRKATGGAGGSSSALTVRSSDSGEGIEAGLAPVLTGGPNSPVLPPNTLATAPRRASQATVSGPFGGSLLEGLPTTLRQASVPILPPSLSIPPIPSASADDPSSPLSLNADMIAPTVSATSTSSPSDNDSNPCLPANGNNNNDVDESSDDEQLTAVKPGSHFSSQAAALAAAIAAVEGTTPSKSNHNAPAAVTSANNSPGVVIGDSLDVTFLDNAPERALHKRKLSTKALDLLAFHDSDQEDLHVDARVFDGESSDATNSAAQTPVISTKVLPPPISPSPASLSRALPPPIIPQPSTPRSRNGPPPLPPISPRSAAGAGTPSSALPAPPGVTTTANGMFTVPPPPPPKKTPAITTVSVPTPNAARHSSQEDTLGELQRTNSNSRSVSSSVNAPTARLGSIAASPSSVSAGGISVVSPPSGSVLATGVFANRRSSIAPGGKSSFQFGRNTFSAAQLELSLTSPFEMFSPKLNPRETHAPAHIDLDESLDVHFGQPSILSSDKHLPPISLSIHGVDGLISASCPRLMGVAQPTKVYVATALLHGNSILPNTVASTREIDFSFAPRWEESILPGEIPVQYADVFHETRLAIVLVVRFGAGTGSGKDGKEADSKADVGSRDVPVSWCCTQMFDARGYLLSGLQHLEMWPLAQTDNLEAAAPLLAKLGSSQFITESQPLVIGSSVERSKTTRSKESGGLFKAKKSKDASANEDDEQEKISYKTKGIDMESLAYLFRGANVPNFITESAAIATISLNSFLSPVIYHDGSNTSINHNTDSPAFDAVQTVPLPQSHASANDSPDRFRLELLTSEDALYTLTADDKKFIWLARSAIRLHPKMLPKFIESVDWSDPTQREECYSLLNSWAEFTSPAQLIAVLDQPCSDYRVRQFAVQKLKRFSAGHLQLYMLQLTQCLKFEPYHNSPLARFLIQQCVLHPTQLGHFLYWNLKNEMACDPPFALRFGIILECFLTHCPNATEQLRSQQQIVDECRRLAVSIQRKKSELNEQALLSAYNEGVLAINRDFLQRLPQGHFQLPLDPRWQAKALLPSKCKIMSSKMAPLWLVFENADPLGDSLYVIFKAGDDLRQDILTLQILRFMDEVWLHAGLDLHLSPYNVIATGMTDDFKGCGFIQVVMNSQTTAGIQREFGGGASGAFQENTIWEFLVSHNSKENLARATDNFVRSCAGYCVATYILGIGDRHNGNIMVTNDGHLFHIDFGHFLGNFKSKFGMNRERAAFVCTPEMAYAMGGSSDYKSNAHYATFVEYCVSAFIEIRKHAVELETLFLTMVSAGMPELLNKQDILYVRKQLCLDLTEAQAIDAFKTELKKALTSTTRKLDNFVHLVKHSSKA